MVVLPVSAERAMVLVAAPEFLSRHGAPHSPQDLPQCRCIVPSFDASYRLDEWEFVQNGQTVRIRVPAVFTANSTLMAKQAALDALGIVWLPQYAVSRELSDGSLKEILADCRITYSPMALYYPQNRHKTRAAQALIDFLKSDNKAA